MRKLILIILVISTQVIYGQKVGLVLSGGAAKGLAHLGAIKALEENNIPIDYVVGTSMGSVIGACYAAGFSVPQMEEILLSDDFQKWVKGEIRNEYNYYFNKEEDNASWVNIDFSIDSSLNASINSSLANDLSINYVLAERFARESEVAKNDFDSLFVPFRAVASEIFTQRTIVLESGSLGKAVRASMSVPFFYRPIKVDDQYLFDGGIYNNFPVDVMKDEFKPDVIIGVNVSSKVFEEYPSERDDQLIGQSLLFMMVDKSDPSAIDDTGVYIQPDMTDFTALDFDMVSSMIDSGYVATLRQMEEIKSKIGKRSNPVQLSQERQDFLGKRKKLDFGKIKYHGFNSRQRYYITKLFGDPSDGYSIEDIHVGYYKLVSEDYFKTVYPDIVYNPLTERFTFHLYGRPRNNFSVGLGGVISSRNISHVNLSMKYYRFDQYFSKTNVNFYAGNFYKSASLISKFMLPGKNRVYIGPRASYNNWNFLNITELILNDSKKTVVDQVDRQVGLHIGLPLGAKYKFTAGADGFNNKNLFTNNNVLNSSDTLDSQKILGFRYHLNISNNTLNRPQYASSGKKFDVRMSYFDVEEEYVPGNTSSFSADVKTSQKWFRLKLNFEQYFNNSGRYKYGYLFESSLSNQSDFTTFTGTIINTPAFNPLSDSRTLILQKQRAYNYIAIGLKNVFVVTPKVDIRLEGYAFKSLNQIVSRSNQTVKEEGFDWKDVFLSGTAAVVYHSPIGPIAVSTNYYDDPENQFGVFIHLGYLLFKSSALD